MRQLLLIGGGHSHALVLRSFGLHKLPADVRVTLLCNSALAPYSGMLPGYVAGHYTQAEVHIDLQRLANFAGARLQVGSAVGIDRHARRVLCASGEALDYDFLSINIGSTPQQSQVPGAAAHSVPVKPVPVFDQRWRALLAEVGQIGAEFKSTGKTTSRGRILRIAVVGGGAGGVELLLAMQFRLHSVLRSWGLPGEAIEKTLEFHLLTQGPGILATHNAGVQQRFTRVLAQRGVQLHRHAEVSAVHANGLRTQSGLQLAADAIFWVTQAAGAPWLQTTGLALDAQGFIEVNTQLQSMSDPRIFAAGDTAAIVGHPLAKAGVFAVRQARPLANNLRRIIAGKPLLHYHPQRRWLALISTGNQEAVASYGAIGFGGAWVWRWKDRIDRRFMRQFANSGMK